AEIVQAQRQDDVDRARERSWKGEEAHRTPQRPAAAYQPGDPLARGGDRGHANRPDDQPDAAERDGGEDLTRADLDGGRAEHRTGDDAEDGGRYRRARHLAAAIRWRDSHHPREPTGPGERPANTLDEARRVEHRRARPEAEDDARNGHQPKAGEDGRLDAEARRAHASRQGGEQRARR